MRLISKSTAGALAAGAVAFALCATAAPAYAGVRSGPSAPPLQVIKTLSSAYIGPLQFAVDGSDIYVADAFTSTLNRLDRSGTSKVIATGPDAELGGDIAGVAVDPDRHTVAYTSSTGDHATTTLTILRKGAKPVVADLSGFESRRNPDVRTTYGLVGPVTDAAKACLLPVLVAGEVPGAAEGQVTYAGQKDSHPYAVASLGDGAWAVADAGGNDIVKVDRWGHVSLLSVLPRQEVTITQALADGNGLPACSVGLTYAFEPVPTDVEVGPGGALYVTTLPGGLGGPDNPGSVYRINRWGQAQKVATGFAGATNLAIDPRGTIYVAQIGAGAIAKVVNGRPVPVATLPGVVAVEWANGQLYASTSPAAAGAEDGPSGPEVPQGPPPPGTIVKLGAHKFGHH